MQLAAYEEPTPAWDLDLDFAPQGGIETPTATAPVGRLTGVEPMVRQAFMEQIPDPEVRRAEVARRLEEAVSEKERDFLQAYLGRLDAVRRPSQVRLSLREVIERTLANNYAVLGSSYGPAIDSARIVQAEAAFDALYFFNFTNNEQDRPSASELASTVSTVRRFDTGVRKLLATGTQAEIAYAWTRTESNLVFQTLNPAYDNNFVVTLRQPLLRGFGLDFNRSTINIRKNDRRISFQQFRRQVRDTLQQAEDSLWLLVQARRALTVDADLLYETEKILSIYEARAKVGFDVYKAQLGQIRSRYATREAAFVEARNNVKDAEDRLKNVMNDPQINLAADMELIPADLPWAEPLVLDRLGEIQTALDNRSELKEARLLVENARISIDAAKNQALPRFDLTFRYTVDGLGESADDAFDQLTMNDFHEYFVGVEFEWPIGNRGPRALIRQSRLQHYQAIAEVKRLIEQIALQVNLAMRGVINNYEQLRPNTEAILAALDSLGALRAREETKDPAQLETELGLQDAVANSRLALLQSAVDYNRATTALQAAKGVLLGYYNVSLLEGPRGADDLSDVP